MEKDKLGVVLLSLVKDYLRSLKLDNLILQDVYLEFPSQKEYGDLSLNISLKLSKIFKKPSQQIADSIVNYLNSKIKDTILKKYIASIQIAAGGFINFFLSEDYFRGVLKQALKLGDNFSRINVGRKRRVLIEFVSANPTGPLSVAHARQAAVGDALGNILKFLGFDLKREYYLNDEGNQINLLGRSIEARIRQLKGESIELPEGGYEGEYILNIARDMLKEKLLSDYIQEILPHAFGDRLEFFSDYGVKYILKIIKKELQDCGIEFDSWYSQKELTASGKIKMALDRLKKKDFIYEKDAALWFKSTAFADDKDRVVVKNDGSYTYLAPDIAYHNDKYKRGFNWLINIWGPDHHGYISRLKAAVQALGEPPESLSIIIVQLATILKDAKPLPMSTRKGQYITLREILNEVGSDASRFFFLMRRTSAHLNFDLELAKRQTPDNPVYYVQYAHARISSIMRNLGFKSKILSADLNLLREAEELRLMKRIWQFPRVLETCYKSLDPYFVTIYLQEAAEDFHRFYDRHRVLGEDKELTQARVALISAIRMIINRGLKLLGISTPETM